MKKTRHEKIKALIARHDITTQHELVARLADAGHAVTQATVSRDIGELKLVKRASPAGNHRYVLAGNEEAISDDKYLNVMRGGFVSLDTAQNIIVMKTVAGMAMAVAAAIDTYEFPEIIGCVGGDDTIMIVARSNVAAVAAKKRILAIL